MVDDPLGEPEISRAVELATRHIEEAEEVLWTIADRAESDRHSDQIEAVIPHIWDVQNELQDLEQELKCEN